MASSNLKLYYLDIRGLGEICRIILAYAGKKYEDIQLDNTAWLNEKQKMPLGKVPVLEIDGKMYPQSSAIWSFLAKEFDLYPAENSKQFIVDIVAMVYHDLDAVIGSFYYNKDFAQREKLKEESWPKAKLYLDYLENLLAEAGTGYFVGNGLTLADIIMFDVITGTNRVLFGPLSEPIDGGVCEIPDLKDRYPWMVQNMNNVLKNERIAAYVQTRKASF